MSVGTGPADKDGPPSKVSYRGALLMIMKEDELIYSLARWADLLLSNKQLASTAMRPLTSVPRARRTMPTVPSRTCAVGPRWTSMRAMIPSWPAVMLMPILGITINGPDPATIGPSLKADLVVDPRLCRPLPAAGMMTAACPFPLRDTVLPLEMAILLDRTAGLPLDPTAIRLLPVVHLCRLQLPSLAMDPDLHPDLALRQATDPVHTAVAAAACTRFPADAKPSSRLTISSTTISKRPTRRVSTSRVFCTGTKVSLGRR